MTRPTAQMHHERMATARTIIGAGVLVLEAGIGGLGVLIHYGLTAEYGNINDSALEGWISGFTMGVGGIALALVVAVAALAFVVSPLRGMRLAAVLLPVGMVVGMLAVTPVALGQKLEVQYDAAPQCVFDEEMGPGPGSRAARQSQQAFESIEHVGHFGGGGGSGVGGCFRSFVLTEDVDVLQHYRAALPEAGWRVVKDDAHRLRAERDGMAFELVMCGRGGVVWAGTDAVRGGARCDQGDTVHVPGDAG